MTGQQPSLDTALRALAHQYGDIRQVADTATRLAAADDIAWARGDGPAEAVVATVHDTAQHILGRQLHGAEATRLAVAVRATTSQLLEDRRGLAGLEQFLARLEHAALDGQPWASTPHRHVSPSQWRQILHHARHLVDDYAHGTGYAAHAPTVPSSDSEEAATP